MDIDKKIEELRKEFNEKIEELKREYKKEKSRNWIPKEKEEFFCLDESLEVIRHNFYNTPLQNMIIKHNRIFEMYDEAQKYADYLKARKEYSYEFSKEEWEDYKIEKYLMYYNYQSKKFRILCCSNCRDVNAIYFKTRKKAQAFIDKYKKQILKFEFGIEEE